MTTVLQAIGVLAIVYFAMSFIVALQPEPDSDDFDDGDEQ